MRGLWLAYKSTLINKLEFVRSDQRLKFLGNKMNVIYNFYQIRFNLIPDIILILSHSLNRLLSLVKNIISQYMYNENQWIQCYQE